jgi:Zn-dependent peptidase ImmA (M78 family)
MVINILGRNIIALNSRLNNYGQRLILAHELGHFALSPRGTGYFFISENTLMESKFEYEANRFAIELLAGDEEPDDGESIAIKNKIPQSLAGVVFTWSRWSESNRRPAHYE